MRLAVGDLSRTHLSKLRRWHDWKKGTIPSFEEGSAAPIKKYNATEKFGAAGEVCKGLKPCKNLPDAPMLWR